MSNRDWQQKMLDMLNSKSKAELDAESEMLIKKLNRTMKQDHTKLILEGKSQELIELVQKGWVSKETLYNLPLDYYDKGEFENCYKCLISAEEVLSHFGEFNMVSQLGKMRNLFEEYEYGKVFPEPFDHSYPQSIENPNESYDELNIIQTLQSAKTDQEFQQILANIQQQTLAVNYEVKANAFFILGDMSFLQNDLENASSYYLTAININPNKALYWGYMAQLLNRADYPPFMSSRFCMRAIQLDPENPRWHLLQSLILFKLVNRGEQNLANQAITEAHKALGLCRPEQTKLKSAIYEYINRK